MRTWIGIHRVAFIVLLTVASNTILATVLPTEDWRTEVARIAASIAKGQGFSSPFSQATGPSAWIPPLYPYLLAGIFHIFGLFSLTSYWVAVALNILIHALTCILLYRVAGEVFGGRAGWYSACALASFPLVFYPLVLLHLLGGYGGLGLFISPNIIWYTHLSEFAIVAMIGLTLHPPHWFVYGASWGLVSLLNPSVLALAPAFLGYRLWRSRNWLYIGLALTTAVLCVAPWVGRNYIVFHRLFLIRDNFGVELRVGNRAGQNGFWDSRVHPDRNPEELRRVIEMGEAEYARAAGKDALRTIRAHPIEFGRNTILRIRYWWIGSPMSSRRLGTFRFIKYLPLFAFSLFAFYGAYGAMRHKNRDALLFVAALIFYPLVYYVTHIFGGLFYQYPIHPEMIALATSAIIKDTGTKQIYKREVAVARTTS